MAKVDGATFSVDLIATSFDSIRCLGNHEFDDEISGLGPFLKNVTFPVVCANINVTGIDEMQPVVKRTKLDVGGYQVGIVGYITVTTEFISKTDPVVFLDEMESVRQQVKELQKEGVNRIIALGHAGIEMDKKIAREVEGVDIVIGGHTNTFLYNGDPPSIEKPEGSYPEVITQKGGEKVLVVQEFAYGKYLGRLKVEFDSQGRVKSWSGNPILLNNSVEQDPDILLKMEPFQKKMAKLMKTFVGQSSVLLLGSKECRTAECNLGNLIADSMVFWYIHSSGEDSWSSSAISLINGGSIRSAIEPGNITYVQIAEALPFQNSIDIIEATGKLLLDILEHSVKDYDSKNGKFLQVSGIKVIYDLSKPNGQRIVSVKVRCAKCLVPTYENLHLKKIYKIGLSDFLINGGDGYSMIKNNIKHRIITGMDQSEILIRYLKHYSPVFNGIEGRITLKNETTIVDDSGATTNRRLNIKNWMMIIISVALTMLHESLN
ncbi:5'-nucleotidase-like [Octopus sinensis]|uniref:5'-nucleotidase n=1 Tax=Octopus sinensis TaxID=2607531 RepID=A0A6P7SRT3_9MOLL|nr:5'-nucleotidase-like [Octopus sinensis]